MQNIPSINSAPAATQEDNPIKSLLRQLNVNANGHSQASPHIDTVWPQPPPQINTQFNAQNWLAQVCARYSIQYRFFRLIFLGRSSFVDKVVPYYLGWTDTSCTTWSTTHFIVGSTH